LKTTIEIKPSAYRKLSDEELVRRYLEMHEYQAYNVLFDRYSHLVYGMCYQHTHNGAEARKKTEELFIKLISDVKLFKSGNFKQWMLTYVPASETENTHPQNNTGLPKKLQSVKDLGLPEMNHLSEKERLCMQQFYEGKKSLAQIAKNTGMSLPVVKQLLYSAKEHMSTQMEATGSLAHVFDDSNCLSRRQMAAYVSTDIAAEERHAIEHHLNNCALCNGAVEGIQKSPIDAIIELDELNVRFLNDHFSVVYPQVHVSSFVADGSNVRMQNVRKIPTWVNVALGSLVAAVVIIAFCVEKYGLHISIGH
jgi:DNA-directed RNA polymerase specialized sigma24 family protein